MSKHNYKNTDWLNFRVKVFEFDNFTCCSCGRSEPRVVLQVHHKLYYSDRELWQYSLDEVETLCRGCHALHHQKIIPRDNWILTQIIDLGETTSKCDFCNKDIRYEHHLHHPNYTPMISGSKCVKYLTDNSRQSLREINQYKSALRRFINSTKWENTHEGINIDREKNHIYIMGNSSSGYKIQINDRHGVLTFLTESQAIERAFLYFFFKLKKHKEPLVIKPSNILNFGK